MQTALTQKEVSPVLASLATLEMESSVQVSDLSEMVLQPRVLAEI